MDPSPGARIQRTWYERSKFGSTSQRGEEMISADAAQHLLLDGAVDGRHLCRHCLGDLHGIDADASACTVDQNLLPASDIRSSHEVKRIQPAKRYRCRLFKAYVVRLRHQCAAGRQAYVFAVCTQTECGRPENLISRLEPGNVFADGFDFTGKISTQYLLPWPGDTHRQSQGQPKPLHRKLGTAHLAVRLRCLCRMHSYQDFIVLRDRFFHLLELQNIRWSVLGIDNGFHNVHSSIGNPR